MMTFEQLEAWREAKNLAVAIYQLGQTKPLATDFSLRDQIQRASVSIMSNIAEGYERLHIPEKRQFYNIARAARYALNCISSTTFNLSRMSPLNH